MDKQKQIEEKELQEFWEDVQFCTVYESEDSCFPLHKETAINLYNAGYRKIPENAVVLETSVYESLEIKSYRDFISERVRKETAEKFAEMLKAECFDGGIDEKWVAVSFSRLDEIAKEITEGKV